MLALNENVVDAPTKRDIGPQSELKNKIQLYVVNRKPVSHIFLALGNPDGFEKSSGISS